MRKIQGKITFEKGLYHFFFSKIHIFITTRKYNFSSVPYAFPIISAKQVHGNKILFIDKENKKSVCADGLLTKKDGLILEIKTADCFPVALFNDRVISILHIGWKGAVKKILQKGIIMFKKYTDENEIYGFVGPGIGKCCYEVKWDVARFFKGFIERKNKRSFLDLKKYILSILLKNGIPEKNIYTFNKCTSCENTLFYSHRKGDKERLKIWILKKP